MSFTLLTSLTSTSLWRDLIFSCVSGEGGEEVERGAVGSEEKDDGGETASC